MTPCNEIGRTIQPATGAAEHNPDAAAPDIFTASVNNGGSNAPTPTVSDRLGRIERELDAIRREAA